MIQGIGASAGIALGKAFVLPTWEWDIPDSELNVADLANEIERLYAGIRISKQEINVIKGEISEVIGKQESSIFDAHLAILDDPVFMQEVQGIISRQYKVAEVAVKEAIEKFANMFDLLDDEYMRERALDIKDVGNRLLKHLLGTPEVTLPTNTAPFILVARELSPSQLAHLNPQHVLGIVNMVGGKTSHAAIMARALGIPFVLGIEEALERPIVTGDFIVLDGDKGLIAVNPEQEIIEQYDRKREQWQRQLLQLRQLSDVPAITRDGQQINIDVNMSSIKDLQQGLAHGVSGVGLFRTEFMFLDRDELPSEEEQFQVFREALDLLGHKPLIIRTLDIGGDKEVDYMSLREEENPFLGYRAIRFCLDEPEMFKTQLRAILRASHYGHVKLTYPLISSLQELRAANKLLAEAKEELRAAGIPFDDHMEVGIIIELPSAVVIADLLAAEVDFFSIGTNDLIQYTLAVDRMNEHVSHLYDPYHPAIIRMLTTVVEAARHRGIAVTVCGEMASDPYAMPIWLGLGVFQLSMSSQAVLAIKHAALNADVSECRQMLQHVSTLTTGEEIYSYLQEQMQYKLKEGNSQHEVYE